MSLTASELDTAQALISAVLLAASVFFLPLAYLRAWQQLAGARHGALACAWAAAAAARWLAPATLAMVFIGYRLTTQAASLLPLAHYGASASAFYHLLFAVAPVDHATIMAANATVGALTLPLAAAFAARWNGDHRAGTIAAWMFALLPLFLRNDCSEANNVPVLWWLFGGLALAGAWADGGRGRDLVGAVLLLALACTARPEVLFFALPLAGAYVGLARGEGSRFRDYRLWVGVLALVAIVTPHLLHVTRQAADLLLDYRLPGYDLWEISRLPHKLVWRNALLRWDLYPVAAVACAGAALALPSRAGRRRAWLLASLVVLAAAVYMVDLDEANLVRAHTPAAALATILAAGGLATMSRRRRGKIWLIAGAAAIAASAAPTAGRLFAPTNEATEESLIRETIRALPEGPFIYVRPHYADRRERPDSAGGYTHYHFPDYLLLPPARLGSPRSLTDFLANPSFEPPAFFFRSTRCYAVLRGGGAPPPPGRDEHPLCVQMSERFELEPVFEREVENHGDVWIPYYPASPTLKVGFYRVRGPKGR